MIGGGPVQGREDHVGQFSFYAQDELAGDRPSQADVRRCAWTSRSTSPIPVDNPFSRGPHRAGRERQTRRSSIRASLPGVDAALLAAPRIQLECRRATGSTQIRGGTGIFTGRVPFVWVGNVISNPGRESEPLSPTGTGPIPTSDEPCCSSRSTSTPWIPTSSGPRCGPRTSRSISGCRGSMLGTLEIIYSKDLNAVYMRNADLVAPGANSALTAGRTTVAPATTS